MSDVLLTSTPPSAAAYPLHDLLIIDNLHLHGEINTSSETVTEHIAASIRRGHAQLWPQGLQTQRVALLGGGPSLNATFPDLVELLRNDTKLVRPTAPISGRWSGTSCRRRRSSWTRARRTPGSWTPEEEEQADEFGIPKIALVGRPNVGKSTLVNALVGEERVIAFDQPGTTRDSIYVEFERDGKPYILIDTAGVRRKGKVFETVEKFSVIKTLQAIEDANVVVLVLDATGEYFRAGCAPGRLRGGNRACAGSRSTSGTASPPSSSTTSSAISGASWLSSTLPASITFRR